MNTTKIVTTYMLGIKPGKFPDGGIPSSHLYLATSEVLGLDVQQHTAVLFALSGKAKTGGACRKEPLVEVKNHYVTLTPAGEKLRADIVQIYREAGLPIQSREGDNNPGGTHEDTHD